VERAIFGMQERAMSTVVHRYGKRSKRSLQLFI
jgi:hypothetical protein